jgi:hypothetical protein
MIRIRLNKLVEIVVSAKAFLLCCVTCYDRYVKVSFENSKSRGKWYCNISPLV